MPVLHTVVFRLTHDTGSAAETAFLDAARAALPAIPGVRDFVVRRQVSAKSDLTHQFSMRFADQVAYDGYNTHPAHVDFVATRWASEVVDFQEYDFVDA